MLIYDQSGNLCRLTRGMVWQFSHIDDSVLPHMRQAPLTALYREVYARNYGKKELRLTARPFKMNGAITIEELRHEILDQALEVNTEDCTRELIGVFTGTLVGA